MPVPLIDIRGACNMNLIISLRKSNAKAHHPPPQKKKKKGIQNLAYDVLLNFKISMFYCLSGSQLPKHTSF